MEPAARPATWEDDNNTVCAILVQIVDRSNLRYFREHADNAAGMWESLSKAHQDSSTGGRVYWIRKLVNARMTGEDIDAHIDSLAQSHERLNSLVTSDKPLTPDNVHVAALLSLIPPDWIHCVSALMNQEGVKTETIVKALKNEAVRRESQNEIISVSSTKPKPVKPANPPSKIRAQEGKPRCPLCNRDGHNLNSCNNIKSLIQEHKAAQKARWKASQPESSTSTSSSKPQTRAGRTSAAPLGNYAEVHRDDDSDYSGSECGVTAKNAFLALSTPPNKRPSGDPNLDSGCSMSMTPYLDSVKNPTPNNTPVHLADHLVVEASHKGTLTLPLNGSTSVKTLVVPSLHEPLLSIANLCDEGLTIVFKKSSCDIFDSSNLQLTGTLAGRGYRRGNLYYLPSHSVSQCSSVPPSPSYSDTSLLGYHIRFSHLGLKALKLLLKLNGVVPSVSNDIDVQKCRVCVQTKMHRHPFRSRSLYRSSKPGELIHSDVASYEVLSREGYQYFITFVDDHSKSLTVYPMKNKSDSFSCFKIYRAFFEKSGSHTIQALRTDNGGEYLSLKFTNYLTCSGIKHNPGPPHSPQLNGVAERTNRTIHNFVRSALLTAHLPKSFWVDALRHSLFPYNSFPCHTPAGFKSPNSILNLPQVNFSTIQPFGCLTWYKVPEPDRKKLDPKARSSILLSYLSDGNGYSLWDLEKRSVIKSRDVVFDELVFPYGSSLKPSPKHLSVEIPWPVTPPLSQNPPSVSTPLSVKENEDGTLLTPSSSEDNLSFISLPDLPPLPPSASSPPLANSPPRRTSS
jgi:transposase InsO family protein